MKNIKSKKIPNRCEFLSFLPEELTAQLQPITKLYKTVEKDKFFCFQIWKRKRNKIKWPPFVNFFLGRRKRKYLRMFLDIFTIMFPFEHFRIYQIWKIMDSLFTSYFLPLLFHLSFFFHHENGIVYLLKNVAIYFSQNHKVKRKKKWKKHLHSLKKNAQKQFLFFC